jgi:hypothetical protein
MIGDWVIGFCYFEMGDLIGHLVAEPAFRRRRM